MRKPSKTSAWLKIRQNTTFNVVIFVPGHIATRFAAILDLENMSFVCGCMLVSLIFTVAHSKQGIGVGVFFRQ